MRNRHRHQLVSLSQSLVVELWSIVSPLLSSSSLRRPVLTKICPSQRRRLLMSGRRHSLLIHFFFFERKSFLLKITTKCKRNAWRLLTTPNAVDSGGDWHAPSHPPARTLPCQHDMFDVTTRTPTPRSHRPRLAARLLHKDAAAHRLLHHAARAPVPSLHLDVIIAARHI